MTLATTGEMEEAPSLSPRFRGQLQIQRIAKLVQLSDSCSFGLHLCMYVLHSSTVLGAGKPVSRRCIICTVPLAK